MTSWAQEPLGSFASGIPRDRSRDLTMRGYGGWGGTALSFVGLGENGGGSSTL